MPRTALLLAALALPSLATAQEEPVETVEAVEAVEVTETAADPDPLSLNIRAFFDRQVVVDEPYRDVFAFGQLVTLSDHIGHNAFVFAQLADLKESQTVDGDLFLFGQKVQLNGESRGDAFVFGQSVTFVEGSSVAGDVFAGAESATFDGDIGGSIQGGAGVMRIDGTVNGDVDVEVGELQLGPNARILGDLNYQSAHETDFPSTAFVSGDTSWTEATEVRYEHHESPSWIAMAMWGAISTAWSYLSGLLAASVLLLLGGLAANRPAELLARSPARTMGVGAVVALITPIVALITMITIIGLPLGLLLSAAYVVSLYVAKLVVAQSIGTILIERSGREVPNAYVAVAFGLLIVVAATSVPFLGWLFSLAIAAGGLGALVGAVLAGRQG